MSWVLVDILIGVVAVALLIATAVGLFLHVKRLLRAATSAGARLGEAMPPSPAPRR